MLCMFLGQYLLDLHAFISILTYFFWWLVHLDDFIGYIAQSDVNVLGALQGCVEVKIADVGGHKMSAICGDDAIDGKFN